MTAAPQFITAAEKGIKGKRISVSKANRFLSRQWPGTPLIEEAQP
jgi:hypothetical protein